MSSHLSVIFGHRRVEDGPELARVVFLEYVLVDLDKKVLAMKKID